MIRLSALFALDAAGGGFAVNTLLVLYLDLRFGLSPAVIGATLAAAGTLSAFSQLVAARLARAGSASCARWCSRTCPPTCS